MPKTAEIQAGSDSSVRIIKKYTNRRLYDTHVSRYVTLNEIKDLVLSHNDFKVVDAKTKEDITRATLLQILMEEESNKKPILSNHVIKEFMRFYGDSMQAMMSRYIEHSIDTFIENKASFKSPLSTLIERESTPSMQNFTDKNIETWLNHVSQPSSSNKSGFKRY